MAELRTFEIERLDTWNQVAPEQLGTKTKYWFDSEQGVKFLYKLGREGTGENWAEKIAYHLAILLGIPAANYELATWKESKGVLSPRFHRKDERLIMGNELIAQLTEGYDPDKKRRQEKYNVRRVIRMLNAYKIAPPDPDLFAEFHPGFEVASDYLCGYLLLDAWIANTDRHHENWGVIFNSASGVARLAPTFDHASSLGRELTDEERKIRLETNDLRRTVEYYANRAKSAFFGMGDNPKMISPIQAFQEAQELRPEAAELWLARLRNVSPEQTHEIFKKMPEEFLSNEGAEFAVRMLEYNQRKLIGL